MVTVSGDASFSVNPGTSASSTYHPQPFPVIFFCHADTIAAFPSPRLPNVRIKFDLYQKLFQTYAVPYYLHSLDRTSGIGIKVELTEIPVTECIFLIQPFHD